MLMAREFQKKVRNMPHECLQKTSAPADTLVKVEEEARV
jgi:hypothetical protein